MSKYRNQNYDDLRTAVVALGGKVLSIRAGKKHFLVYVETPKGRRIRLTLSKAPMREGYVRTWTRQHFRRADK